MHFKPIKNFNSLSVGDFGVFKNDRVCFVIKVLEGKNYVYDTIFPTFLKDGKITYANSSHNVFPSVEYFLVAGGKVENIRKDGLCYKVVENKFYLDI